MSGITGMVHYGVEVKQEAVRLVLEEQYYFVKVVVFVYFSLRKMRLF